MGPRVSELQTVHRQFLHQHSISVISAGKRHKVVGHNLIVTLFMPHRKTCYFSYGKTESLYIYRLLCTKQTLEKLWKEIVEMRRGIMRSLQ